ncbi:MAG: rod shape-determining protein MreD [Candidatus Omnitrophica bacterium ADurb.Bin314]|nr:MAG: rod shape-determining protein MreD [Candidatus Omnitrophica bacterium ADurb.Bin314]
MSRLATFKIAFFFLFLAILDHSVMPAFRIGNACPSFLYIWICYVSFEWEARKTIPVAFWAGLLKDLMSGGPLGFQTGILVAVAFLLDQTVQRIEREFPGIYFLLTFLFVLLCEASKLVLEIFVGRIHGFVPVHLGVIFLMALYTALLLPVFDILAGFWLGRRSLTRQYELFR